MGGTICRTGRTQNQVSKSLLWLPWYFVNRFIESTRIAEETLGRPATIHEIFATLNDTYGKTVNNIYEAVAILFSLLREDLLYSDEHSYRYTVNRQEGYYNYSELFHRKYPVGYACGKNGHIVPTTARRINVRQLIGLLTSRDEAQYQENGWIWDKEFRFTDGEPIDR